MVFAHISPPPPRSRRSRARGLLPLGLTLLWASEAAAATVGINGGGCAYTTLQAAVNAAGNGDTLWVEADGVTHVESTVINTNNLTIRAAAPGTNCLTPSGGPNALFKAEPGFSTLSIWGEGSIDYLKLIDITLSGGNGWRAGNIDAVDADTGFNLLLFDSAIVGGDSPGKGGGIHIGAQDAFLFATDTTFLNNRAADAGGAIWNGQAFSVTQLEGSTQISLSRADGMGTAFGGGGAVNSHELVMRDDAQIANAQASNVDGGCVDASFVKLFDDASIVDCDTDGQGGAIVGYSVDLRDRASVRDGTAQGNGGLISADFVYLRGDVRLEDGVSQGNGGLVYLDSWPGVNPTELIAYATTGEILLRGGRAFDGAGIYAPAENGQVPTIELQDGVRLRGNEATGFGGAVFVEGGTLDVTGNVIIGDVDTLAPERNVAMSGAGIYAEGGAVVTLGNPVVRDIDAWRLDPNNNLLPFEDYGVHLTQNNATHSGAGIELSGAELYGYQPAIYNNRAVGSADGGDGGGIAAVNGSRVELQEFHIAHNRARRAGGGIYAHASDVYLGYPQDDADCYVEADNQLNRFCNELQFNEAGRPLVGEGGAIYASSSSYVELGTVGLWGNGAHAAGAHLFVDGSSDALLERNLLANVSDQWASTQGAVVKAGGSLEARLNTFAGRGATLDVEAGATGLAEFNVLWADGQPGAGLVLGGSFSGTCNVGTGVSALTGANNLVADPDFVTAARGEFRIPTTSVVRNHCTTLPTNPGSGLFGAAELVRDLDGTYIDASVEPIDPGAFEAQ